MSATLKLTHKTIGVEVRRGTYDALVDGKHAGTRRRPGSFRFRETDRSGRRSVYG